MKKSVFIIIISIFFVLIFSIYFLIQYRIEKRKIEMENSEYTIYLNKNIDGAQLMTLINKVIDKNEKNAIDKDENNVYTITDNSLRIDVKFIDNEEIIPFEYIYNSKSSQFIKYFGTSIFKCTNVEYHSNSNNISYMMFEEQ